MSTYKELTAQIETLQKQAAHARQSEIADAIADIKEKMKDYGITLADLGLAGGVKKASKAKEPVAAKYRDSESGSTWSGRGKPPRWIAGKDRDLYIIK
ncbi:H-NS histone family protein [Actimicrobium antarcticum]|uniref:H-NS histone family protein n=1 Tax=Actimicrobium antarcticum TaxID=1051899 RepID=A0ABP7TV36_9BURK